MFGALHCSEVWEGVSGGFSLCHGTCFKGICPSHPAGEAQSAPSSMCPTQRVLPTPSTGEDELQGEAIPQCTARLRVRALKELEEAEREGVKASLPVPAGLLQRQQRLLCVSTELPLPEEGKPQDGAEESSYPAYGG